MDEKAAAAAQNTNIGVDISAKVDINQYINDVFEFFGGDAKDKQNYRDRLNQSGVPTIHDWFSGYGTDYSNSNQMIIMALIAVVVVVVIASMFSGK